MQQSRLEGFAEQCSRLAKLKEPSACIVAWDTPLQMLLVLSRWLMSSNLKLARLVQFGGD